MDTNNMRDTANELSARARSGRGRRAALAACAFIVVLLALAPAPASAGRTHLFLEKFGSASQPTFNQAVSVAVDQPSGDLLALGTGRNEIQELKFTGFAEGDTFKLGFDGKETAAIAYASDVHTLGSKLQAAFDAVFGPGALKAGIGNLSVTFSGVYSSSPQSLISCTKLTGSGNCSAGETRAGQISRLQRFKPNGEPDPFPALGSNAIDARPGSGGKPCAEEAASCDKTPQGRLIESRVLALDQSGGPAAGDIYIAQGGAGGNVVDVFSSDGHYLGQLTGAGAVDFAVGGPLSPAGLAVDPGGNLFVSTGPNEETGPGKNTIYEFSPSANPPENEDGAVFSTAVAYPQAIAAGAGPTVGSLFVLGAGGLDGHGGVLPSGRVLKLDSSGVVEYTVVNGFNGGLAPNPSGQANALAVDPASGHLFVSRGGCDDPCGPASEFDVSSPSSAAVVADFGSGSGSWNSFGFGGAGEKIYRGPSENIGTETIGVFGPLVPIPDVATGAASDIATTAARLNGTVKPDGAPVEECFFQYGPTKSYGATAPCTEPNASGLGSGATVKAVHAGLSGLSVESTYHFQLVAKNKNGTVRGADQVFDTAGKPRILADYSSEVGFAEATLRAKINPRNLPTTYRFEWGPDASYGQSTADAPLGSDAAAHAVSLPLEGLDPGTAYHWRIVAENSLAEAAAAVHGPDRTFTTFRTPEPNASCPNQALRNGPAARLPDCRAYEMVSPVDKNGGDVLNYVREGFALPQAFGGLDQSTPDGAKLAYSSATAFAGAAGGPAFSEYIASRAPSGWSTEAINPPERGGLANHILAVGPQYAAFSEDLSTGWLKGESGLPLTPGPVPDLQNLYRRDNATGEYAWLESSSPEPETCVGDCAADLVLERLHPQFEGVAKDGNCAAFRVNDALTPEAPRGLPPVPQSLTVRQLYLWCEGEGMRLASVLPGGGPFEGESSGGTEAFSAIQEGGPTVEHALSADGSRLYWSTFSQEPQQLYLRVNAEGPYSFAKGSGDLSLLATGKGNLSAGSTTVANVTTTTGAFAVGESISAGVIPAGTTIAALSGSTLTLSAPASASGTGVTLNSGSRQVANLTTTAGAFAVGQEVSASGIPAGAKVTACSPSCGPAATSLTLSLGPTKAKAGVPLSASSDCTGPEMPCTLPVSVGGGTPQFWTANPDGSRAIFSMLGGFSPGLYEYVYDGVEGKGKATRIAEQTFGVAGASEDLSRLYFASEEVLTGAQQNSGGDAAQAGEPNLYLDREGTFTFIGTLVAGDVSRGGTFAAPGPLTASARSHVARAGADGEHLAFVSAAQLTGYDNADASSGEADREVYIYDAGTGSLACASCNPSGARPQGADLGTAHSNISTGGIVWTAAYIPGYQRPFYGRRPLSEDGSRLFFNSVDALVPQDINDALDVYEWEAPESGDCAESSPAYSPQNGGCINLISSGESPEDSEFVDASQSGDDVFFRTSSSLDPRDPGLIDIYDARVEGGVTIPVEAAACEGEACQSAPEAPNDPTPSSESFVGAGNVREEAAAGPPAHCPKGKVRRKGHCVAKKHKRAKRRHARHASRNRRAAR